MRTKEDWDQDIRNITNLIYRKYPELTKYISEIPFNDPGKDEVTTKGLEDYYHSLEELVYEYAKTHGEKVPRKNIEKSTLPGYPLYPPSEDIYSQGKKEMNLNPEDLSKNKSPNEKRRPLNEKDFEDDMSGDDLDVPGSELDDQQESVGSEDEENNYYSLGGDNHEDLEEDKG
ncbi:hypothetical protein [Algoriphagus marinus]|uniref:hypothetical protein n=1 Tax=Algoriphagus marinus TaxID=1925762 RepID=UPI000A8B4A67|nr:hypothetical protein [Algoriphagus marinus]